MPTFTMSRTCQAPLAEVWKLVHDPSRYPEWWFGVGSVAVTQPVQPGPQQGSEEATGEYVLWPEGYPDYPMPQRISHAPERVTISCLVSDLVFTWQLHERDDRTSVDVTVEIPEREQHRLETQRQAVARSLDALARLAADITAR